MAKSSRENYATHFMEKMKALKNKKEEEEEFLRMLDPTEEIKFRKIIEEGRKVYDRIARVPLQEENSSNDELN
jgi:hypothetical protein